jgi:uncharacterized protein HemX
MTTNNADLTQAGADLRTHAQAPIDPDTSSAAQQRRVGDSPAHAEPQRRSALASWALFFSLLSLAASAVIGFWSIERSKRLERNAAEKVISVETDNRELKLQLKATSEQLREVAARQSLAEAKLSDALAQQGQLEKQYQEMVRSRSDAQLADIEVGLSGAAAQLQFSGNVRSALLSLQEADARLERMNQPPLLGVRRLLGKDIERLRQVQVADTTALAGKVDYLIETVPQMRLLSEPSQTRVGAQASEGVSAQSTDKPLIARIGSASERGWEGLKRELLQLFRVQKLDNTDVLLVSPEQAFFVRENIKLRLAALRAAVAARNQPEVKRESGAASAMLQKYFDSQQSGFSVAMTSLNEVGAAPVSVDLPNLNETISLIRSLRTKEILKEPEKIDKADKTAKEVKK